MAKTIEQRVSDAILQEKKIVKIGGVDYEIAPPSAAVWVKASAIASKEPVGKLDDKDIIGEIFRNAVHYEVACQILAVMILGVKSPAKRTIFKESKDEYKELAAKLILAPPSEVKAAMSELFVHHEAGFFFGTITFLSEIAMTKPTKTEMTASGQQ